MQTFEKNYSTIVLNVLYTKEIDICPAYISKLLIFQNVTQTMKKKITILMIPCEKGWHYLALKKLSTLLRGITSKHNGNLDYFRTENKLECREQVCKNEASCGIALPTQKNNTLKFNQYVKSDKTRDIIYSDLESLI